MKIKTPQDLFLHELGDALGAEATGLGSLKVMRKATRDPLVKQAIEQHIEETEAQIENLGLAFVSLGKKPRPTKCRGADGIAREFESGVDDIEVPEVREMFLVGAAGRAESYEIAAYTDLVSNAERMGHDEVARLLRQNLEQEEAFRRKLEGISRKIADQATLRAEQKDAGKRGASA